MEPGKANEMINKYIRPATFPIALKLCQTEDELPDKVRRPMRDMGHPINLCQGTALTRRYGWSMALSKEDQCCIGGAQAMGFIPKGSEGPVGKDKQFESGKYRYHLTATLERADFDPDVVIVFGNSAQIMRLVQSATGGPGGQGKVNAVATGFGDCGDIAARTVLSGECQFILPSGGDRVFGSTQNHEVIFTTPGSKLGEVMESLEKTHKMGFRYPVVTDIRHRPNLPPFLEIPKESD